MKDAGRNTPGGDFEQPRSRRLDVSGSRCRSNGSLNPTPYGSLAQCQPAEPMQEETPASIVKMDAGVGFNVRHLSQ